MNNGSEKESGQFRVYKHVVYKGAKKVGTIQPRGTDTTLTITDFPKLNGKVELRKIKRDPPVWRGVFHKTDVTKRSNATLPSGAAFSTRPMARSGTSRSRSRTGNDLPFDLTRCPPAASFFTMTAQARVQAPYWNAVCTSPVWC
jgi:hypothetical protein